MHLEKFWKESFASLQGIPGANVLLPMAMVVLSMLGLWQNVQQKLLYPKKYAYHVETYAGAYGLDPLLLYAVIHTESGFQPGAVSKAGALGLTQITPETFLWLQTKTRETLPPGELHEPETAIRYGALFLHMLEQEFGETETALAAYHAGRGRVVGWLRDKSCSVDGRTLRRIPSAGTAHYVRKVMRAYAKYRELY